MIEITTHNSVFGDEVITRKIPPIWMPPFFVLSEGISGAVEPFTTGRGAEVRRRPGPVEVRKVSSDIVTTCGEFLATYQAHLVSPGRRLGIFGN